MLPAVAGPALGGEGSFFLNYGLRVRLRRQVANLGPSKRASSLVLQVDYAARQSRMTADSGGILRGDGPN